MTVPALEWSPLWPHVEPLIVDAQRGKRLPPANSSGWIGPIRSPLREERNPSFSVKPDSETDPGGFTDHGTGDKGSLAELAQLLGVDPRVSVTSEPAPSAIPPEMTLEGFCRRRSIRDETLERFKVRETVHQGRPALRFPTRAGVDRIRFLDGLKPKAAWAERGGRAHWYGLSAALGRRTGRGTLYVVNGEPSVWAAAQSGVPAVCTCSGEGTAPTDDMVRELVAAGLNGLSVVYDRDSAGRDGALAAVEALRAGGLEAVALELPAVLGHGGDVDDLHRRVGDDGLAAALAQLPELQAREPAAVVEVVTPTDPPVQAWPTLDESALHGLVGDVVKAIEPHTEADAVAILVQYLLAFGSAVGRAPHFLVEATRHGTNENAVLVGATAKGRKGTSWDHVRSLFVRADEGWTRQCIGKGCSSGEGIIWAVRDPIEKYERPRKTRENPHPEPELVIADPGFEDKRLLIVESEYATPLKVMERDGKGQRKNYALDFRCASARACSSTWAATRAR
jgi:hypothetical protein